MEINKPFIRFVDYLIPLLIVMEELGQGSVTEAKEAFEKKYENLIPTNYKRRMASGKIRWAYNLEWARNDLIDLELMESPDRGIWAISEDGRIWLKKHSDYETAFREIEVIKRGKTRGRNKKNKPKARFEFSWHGKNYRADAKALVDVASHLLKQGYLPEASRFLDWYAVIDERPVSVKWLFHLLTNAEYAEFVTSDAVGIIRKLGIPVARLKEDLHPKASSGNIQEKVNYVNKTGTDFKAIQSFLLEKSVLLEQAKISIEKNAIEIVFSNLTASHYAFRFTRNEAEIGFYLQSLIPRVNHERIENIKPLAAQWSQSLDREVKAENWGIRWARVYISTDRFRSLAQANYEQMTQTANLFTQAIGQIGKIHPDWEYNQITAEAFATITIRFIEATYSDLATYIFKQRIPKPANHVAVIQSGDPQAHQQLDQKIKEIRGFLAGRAIRTPKDEELCDWIQLCYLFDLLREGQQLFTFVQPQTLNNDWLYRRTKKYADLCRMKVTQNGLG